MARSSFESAVILRVLDALPFPMMTLGGVPVLAVVL
jgi:hypothetical protein